MNASELSSQLSALSDSLKETNSLISRLAKLQFQPGSEPLEGEAVPRIELAEKIHDSLKELEEQLEFLSQDTDDFKQETGYRRRPSAKDSEYARLSAKTTRIAEELVHSRQQFRTAQITAKLASDEAKRKQRELVLEGYRKEAEHLAAGEGENGSAGNDRDSLFAHRGRRQQQQRQLTKDELLVNASSDVTSALRRTHELLSTELSRSRYAQETFDESTAALAQLGEDYSNLDTILNNSKQLLGTLLRSQKSDTWYLETAFWIVAATLGWLFFRRILFGPFVKLPLFLWHVSAFLLKWVILQPLYLFLSVTGVITSEPITSSLRLASTTSSRPPLIIQPSATGRPPSLPAGSQIGIPAGAGGAGAKLGKGSPELAGRMSEQIAKMAEQSAKKQIEPQVQSHTEENDLPRRGDGTVLQERGDIPKNPKKKNFEANTEVAKHEEGETRRKRDEL